MARKKKNQKWYRRILRPSKYLMLTCGIISLYIFSASFETTFNVDLPFVSSVSSIRAEPLERALTQSYKVKQTDYGNYGIPATLKIPSHNSRIILAPSIQKESSLLARANTAHFTLLSAPKDGNMGGILVYMVSTWRTDPNAAKLTPGENLFIDTDRDWRYFYRIERVIAMPEQEQYVVRDSTTTPLLLVVKTGSNMSMIEASLVNVQNVRQ